MICRKLPNICVDILRRGIRALLIYFNIHQLKSERLTNSYLIVHINQKQVKLPTGVKVCPEH